MKKNSVIVRTTELTVLERNRILELFQMSDFAKLRVICRELLEALPNNGFLWKALSICQPFEDQAELMHVLNRATELLPSDPELFSNQGKVLMDFGLLADAAKSLSRAIELKPDFPQAHFNLALVQVKLFQQVEAEKSFRKVILYEPNFNDAHFYLANILNDSGQYEQAIESYRMALRSKPQFLEALCNLSVALSAMNQKEEALESVRQAIRYKPEFAYAHYHEGNLLAKYGETTAAVASYKTALAFDPNLEKAHYNLGFAYSQLKNFEGATTSYLSAIELNPQNAEAYFGLGITYGEQGELDKSIASYNRAIEIMPNHASAYSNLGKTYGATFNLELGILQYRRAIEIQPDYSRAHSNLLFALSQSHLVEARELFAEHRRFAQQFESPLRSNWLPHHNSRNPERCLKVGFVSGDLRNHAAGYLIEPVLEQMASYSQLSLHAYYNYTVEDVVTQRLRLHFSHWCKVDDLTDDALAEKIRADEIDILIDLSGHTAYNRLLTFARKPAPVQVSWIGYPCTTGLQALDYYVADRHFLPSGKFDDQFTERIVRIPAIAPYRPSEPAPPINALPAMSNGYLSFGSFNNPNKINRSVVALWSQLLRALPSARMVLGAMSEKTINKTLLEWFTEEGIEIQRLSFHPKCSMRDYFALHHKVDICLDTFPYNGGTTTFHALWMGVPTLNLTGSTSAGRSGACILGQAGLDAFVAQDREEFIKKGLSWADNLDALAEIRFGLRERLTRSADGQPVVVADALNRAMRIMWQRWCAQLPAETFEVRAINTSNRQTECSQ